MWKSRKISTPFGVEQPAAGGKFEDFSSKTLDFLKENYILEPLERKNFPPAAGWEKTSLE